MDSLEGIAQIDDNPYYRPNTIANPISHFDLARASNAVPGAVGPVDSPRPQDSYLDLSFKDLAGWAATRTHSPSPTSGADVLQTRGPYKPCAGPGEIRVLEIKPGTGDGAIRCALHHCSVDFEGSDMQAPPDRPGPHASYPAHFVTSAAAPTEPVWYTALSYRWGDPSLLGSPVEIGCPDHRIQVTKSLEEILLHVRKPEHSVMMWIDQICINQEDIEEKAMQIPLMSKIYGRALNTLIWLTPSPEFPAEADPFRFFYDFAVKLQFLEDTVTPDDFVSIGLPEPESAAWAELWHVLSQPYFQRLWIIQEVALSFHPWLACGDHLTSWRVFSDACHRLHGSGVSRWLMEKFSPSSSSSTRSRDDAVPPSDACHQVIRLDQLAYMRGINPQALWTLEETRSAISYDPRDKIYGMLGLKTPSPLGPGPRTGWEVDISYRKEDTAAKLYHNIAVQILTTQRGDPVDLLINVDHYQSMDGLPSWVPDWSRARQTTSIGAQLRLANIYTASGTPKMDPTNLSFGAEYRELHIRGWAFDTISASLTAVHASPDITWKDPPANNSTLLSCYHVAKALETYPGSRHHPDATTTTTTTVFDAFWRTLVADKDAPLGLHRDQTAKERAPAAAFAEVFSLLLDASTGASPSLPGQTYSKRQRLPRGKPGRLEPAGLAARRQPAAAFKQLRVALQAALAGRRFGVTERGFLGVFPGYVGAGDVVCVLEGFHVPFVLRPADGEEGKFAVLGECYVHGIMNGEAVAEGKDVEFVLI